MADILKFVPSLDVVVDSIAKDLGPKRVENGEWKEDRVNEYKKTLTTLREIIGESALKYQNPNEPYSTHYISFRARNLLLSETELKKFSEALANADEVNICTIDGEGRTEYALLYTLIE